MSNTVQNHLYQVLRHALQAYRQSGGLKYKAAALLNDAFAEAAEAEDVPAFARKPETVVVGDGVVFEFCDAVQVSQ